MSDPLHVLILGATSPIARALAACYAQRGARVVLAAREADELERIAQDLRLRYQAPVTTARFDATEFDAHWPLIAALEQAHGPLDVAALAFGELGEQADSERDFARAQRVIHTNYTGAVSICEALAARMSERGQGSLVAISSVAGDRGRASNYIYGSAKGALTLYLQGLRNRLHKRHVRVTTVKLGFVDTRMTFGLQTRVPVATPEQAAEAIFEAQQRGLDVLYYPRFWAGVMGLIRAMPEPLFKRLSL